MNTKMTDHTTGNGSVQLQSRRYGLLWRNKWLTAEATTIQGMVTALRAAADELDAMRRAGVVLDSDSGVGDDHALLVTTDPAVAQQFGFDEEEDERNDD
jgi:hypothetical protein